MARRVSSIFRMRTAALLVIAAAILLPLRTSTASSSQENESDVTLTGFRSEFQGCVLYEGKDSVGCRDANPEETRIITSSRREDELQVISPVRQLDSAGLTLVIRGTSQLDNYPQAKAAFLRAAELWQSVIRTQITVTIDVDFGPTWFGNSFPQGVIGFTHPQLLIGTPIYPRLQQNLLRSVSSDAERLLYYNLPELIVKTDQYETQSIIAPSPIFRTLGFIDRIADPATEPGGWGPPPAIGFYSLVNWDFDPSNGIGPDQVDFDAVACHEIGHVLGFYSYVGTVELNENNPLAVSLWDLFRTRPGVTLEGFKAAERIISSGGEQVCFFGQGQLALSTARPNGTGGDEKQASHWKDDAISEQSRIGILDPSLPNGRRETITLKDLAALDAFGYTIQPIAGNHAPTINNLAADLNGDVLTLNGILSDPDGDASRVQLELLDSKGHVLGQTAPFDVDFGIPTTQYFSFPYSNMSTLPAVTQIRLTVVDSKGNKSSAVLADFSGGDNGGPKLISATYTGSALSIKGKRFGEQPQVEVNGVLLTPPSGVVPISNKRLSISGRTADLNLRTGPNRIRIISNGLRSNLLVVEM